MQERRLRELEAEEGQEELEGNREFRKRQEVRFPICFFLSRMVIVRGLVWGGKGKGGVRKYSDGRHGSLYIRPFIQ